MPTQANIAINDGEDTPVEHTFQPAGRPSFSGGHLAMWKVPGSTILEDVSLKVLLRDPNSSTMRERISLEIPVVVEETINGVARSKIERREIGSIELTHGLDSTAQERENTLVMLCNAGLATAVRTAITNREVFSG